MVFAEPARWLFPKQTPTWPERVLALASALSTVLVLPRLGDVRWAWIGAGFVVVAAVAGPLAASAVGEQLRARLRERGIGIGPVVLVGILLAIPVLALLTEFTYEQFLNITAGGVVYVALYVVVDLLVQLQNR